MAVNLVKGQNTVLNMNVFHVGLGWDVNEGASQYEFDLDVAAFMIGSNKKTLGDIFARFRSFGLPHASSVPPICSAALSLFEERCA